MTGAPLILDGVSVRGVLDDVSLAVPLGGVFALLGRNGAGKTTALRCLLGLRRADAGRALLFGRDAWRHRAAAMARLGVVLEDPDAPPELSPRALAAFAAPLYPHWDDRGYADRLRRLGVDARSPLRALSRGEKTQVMLALALAGRPEALVLDDPTLGLDPIARRELIVELIGELAERSTTMLVATHDLAGFEGLATHVGILRHGRLVVAGDVEEVKTLSLEDMFTEVAA